MKSKTLKIKVERPDQGADVLTCLEAGQYNTVGLIEIEIEFATPFEYDEALLTLEDGEESGELDFPFACEEVQS